MPRVKLQEQRMYEFTIPMTLHPRDINYGGHLGNDSLVTLAGTARAQMFHSMGFSEGDLGDGKTGIIMADLAVNYRAEAFIFDEIHIDTHIGEMRSGGFRIFHRVMKADTLIALTEAGVVTFDYTTHRIAHVPEVFTKTVEKIQNKSI
ncbi:MAG: thioesterase family protein [Syntrophorhabdaceae bacterium]|nr:thioesterase family protein [Syntrophorhabdaceae bacterium]